MPHEHTNIYMKRLARTTKTTQKRGRKKIP
jgi:hypothetical protein